MEKVRLGDICTLKQGFQVPINEQITEQKDGYVRFIRIVDYTQHTDDIRYVLNDKRYYFVEKDDIVMVRYGAAGEVGSGIEGVIANNMFLIEPLIDINKAYLRYYLSQEKIRDKLLGLSSSSTMPALNFKIVNALEIPVFERKIQDFIVVLLDRITELIDKRQKQLSKLDELVKARFVELFGDFIEHTTPVDFESICEFVTVGIANSATHAFCDDGVIMFRNQNIKEDYLDTSDIVHITPDFANKYKSKMLKKDDLLIVRTGYPGVACLVPEQYEGCQTFTTLIARIKHGNAINPRFVCHYINSEYGKNYVRDNSAGAAQQNFGATALSKLPICIPPIELQDEYIRFVEQTGKSKLVIQKSLEKLELLKKALMQKYFG